MPVCRVVRPRIPHPLRAGRSVRRSLWPVGETAFEMRRSLTFFDWPWIGSLCVAQRARLSARHLLWAAHAVACADESSLRRRIRG